MLGGAIHRPKTDEPVIVRHTEEVVAKAGGALPLPKDHLTDVKMTPKASADHPIRLINLTKGLRTQLVTGTMVEDGVVNFKNPAAGVNEEQPADAGDHIRIFWEEVITGAASEKETAVEVTISPDTFPGTLTQTVGLLEGNNKYQNNLVNCWESKCLVA